MCSSDLLPPQARPWHTETAATLVAHGPEAPAERRAALDQRGVERLELARCEPRPLLEALAARGANQVLWECGPDLAAAALRQDCVQRVAAVVAPRLLGGEAARTPLGDLGLSALAQAPPWRPLALEACGDDWIWTLEAP